jgi:hypothetical protein
MVFGVYTIAAGAPVDITPQELLSSLYGLLTITRAFNVVFDFSEQFAKTSRCFVMQTFRFQFMLLMQRFMDLRGMQIRL